jgi:hypothetical protein
MRNRLIIWAALFVSLLFAHVKRAQADTIIAPPDPHYLFNSLPFGEASGDGRYQQVYSSSLFSGPINIAGLAFSPDTTVCTKRTFPSALQRLREQWMI